METSRRSVLKAGLASTAAVAGLSASASDTHPWLRWNPHLRFQNNLRGYVNTTITHESLVADFRCVRNVKVQGADVFTRASFTIEDRSPGLQQTYDNPPAAAAARSLATDADTVSADPIAWETARP